MSDSKKRFEYIQRTPRTATKVHRVRKAEALEDLLDEEIEEALNEHASKKRGDNIRASSDLGS